MSLGLGPLKPNQWLDDFMVNEGYEQKERRYHMVTSCWCGSESLVSLGEASECIYQYQRCMGCNCVILKFVLPSEELEELYGIRYFREHQIAIGNPSYCQRYENDSKDRIPVWLDYLKKYCKAGSMLEVGSSHGRFVKELTEKGYKAIGLELDSEICEWAKKKTGCDIRCNTIDEVKDERFDIIFANDVLEHLYNPKEFISNLANLLKPDGKIILQTVVFKKNLYPINMMRPLFHTILFEMGSLVNLVQGDLKLHAIDNSIFGCSFVVFNLCGYTSPQLDAM